jgi:hypothetical protein
MAKTVAPSGEDSHVHHAAARQFPLDECTSRGFNSRPSPQWRSDIQIHG